MNESFKNHWKHCNLYSYGYVTFILTILKKFDDESYYWKHVTRSHLHWSNMWHQVNLFTSRNCIWWSWLFLVSSIFNAMSEVKNIVDYKHAKYIKVTNNRGIIVFSAWMWLLDYIMMQNPWHQECAWGCICSFWSLTCTCILGRFLTPSFKVL